MIEFNSENGNKNGKFKYFYGPANLIKTINNFSKEIYISKNNEDNKLLINFETPFTELIDIQIILIADSPDKYDDFCGLMKFCENYNKDTYNNTKIIKEKIRMRDNTDNFIEISIDKKDIMDFMNKNVDIYVLTKSVGSNLEIYYNVKSQVIDWYQLKKEDDGIIKYNKNLICINCGLYGELKVNNEQNNDDNNNNNQNISSNIIQNNNTNNNSQTNNDYNNTQNNSVNEQNLSNSDNNDNNNNNSPYNNNQRNNIIKFNFGPFYQNNNNNNTEDNNDNKNTNNDNYTNNNDTKRNDNEYRNNNDQYNNNRRNNENKDRNENRINFRNDNNNNDNNNFNSGNVNSTVNMTNNDKENNLKGKHGNEVKEEVKPKKKKSKKLLYFILLILIIGLIYYCRNKYYNEGVSYSKISKYSYYDF